MIDGQVKAVLFDAGNTLIYVDPRRIASILEGIGCDADVATIRDAELRARRGLHDAFGEGFQGTEPEVWQRYFQALFQLSGVPVDRMPDAGAALRDDHSVNHLWTWVEDGTHEALETLAAGGYRLAVISNADGRVEGVLEEVGLRRHFEFVIDSDVIGVSKPDRRIFEAGCERLGLEPAACLYVGDLYPVDYLGATGAGMEAVLIDPMRLHHLRAPTVANLGELPDHLAAARR